MPRAAAPSRVRSASELRAIILSKRRQAKALQASSGVSWWVAEQKAPLSRDEFAQRHRSESARILATSSPVPTAKEIGSAVEVAARRKAAGVLDVVGLKLHN